MLGDKVIAMWDDYVLICMDTLSWKKIQIKRPACKRQQKVRNSEPFAEPVQSGVSFLFFSFVLVRALSQGGKKKTCLIQSRFRLTPCVQLHGVNNDSATVLYCFILLVSWGSPA